MFFLLAGADSAVPFTRLDNQDTLGLYEATDGIIYIASRSLCFCTLRCMFIYTVLALYLFPYCLNAGDGSRAQRSTFEQRVISTLEALKESMNQLQQNPSITQTEV